MSIRIIQFLLVVVAFTVFSCKSDEKNTVQTATETEAPAISEPAVNASTDKTNYHFRANLAGAIYVMVVSNTTDEEADNKRIQNYIKGSTVQNLKTNNFSVGGAGNRQLIVVRNINSLNDGKVVLAGLRSSGMKSETMLISPANFRTIVTNGGKALPAYRTFSQKVLNLK